MAVTAGLVLAAWFGVIVAERGGNPSTLLAAGRDDVRVASYVARELGPSFVPQEGWGHDGKFVFIQAHDPFLLNPDDHAAWLDAPVYRSQRVLVAALVGIGALLGPWGVVWAMPAGMVLAVAVGAWATAGLARMHGRSSWWGLVFLLNPGLFYSYRRGTVDVLAVALLMLGVYLAAGRRFRSAAMALAAAALAKEVMILGALGMAVYQRREGRGILPVVVVPLLAVAAWGSYVRLRLGVPFVAVGADALTAPFRGLRDVVADGRLPNVAVALVVAGLVVVTLVQARWRPSLPAAGAAGFAVLLPVLPQSVWGGYVDAWRAAAPIMALQAVAVVAALPSPAWGRPVPGSARMTREIEISAE